MRNYLRATGIIFALIVAAHVWRVFAESKYLLKDPWFVALTLLAAGMSGWAFHLARKHGKQES